jgi:hypothetical protein
MSVPPLPAAAPQMAPAPDLTPGQRPLALTDAMTLARRAVALFTELQVDTVVSCAKKEGGWLVVVDAIESAARMGDNDMLATYHVTLSMDGEVEGFERTGRYNRADAAR